MVQQAMDINTDVGSSRTIDSDMILGSSPDPNISMALGVSADHPHQYGPQQLHSQKISTSLQAAAQTTDILMAFGGNMGHRNQHRLSLP